MQEGACALAKRKVVTTDPNTNRRLVTLMNQNAESAESADSILVPLLFSELNVRYHPTVRRSKVVASHSSDQRRNRTSVAGSQAAVSLYFA